jgi:L-asparaginase II
MNVTYETIPHAASLVDVRRGPLTESRHRGHVAIVDGDRNLIASLGEAQSITYVRSASKPHQALPVLTSGAADRFKFTDEEIAIMCGSHSGEQGHVQTVEAILKKIGRDSSVLQCGAHNPYSRKATDELRKKGSAPTALHNNCSGKHAGMIALAIHMGCSDLNYYEPEHPVQQMIMDVVAEFCDIERENLVTGIDGCGVPTFALSIQQMALMYARLVAPYSFDTNYREACARIVTAMINYPEMVEGYEELDTELMRAAKGRLISKVGAEGVYTAGVLPSDNWPRGLGLAFKIEDGDPKERARPLIAVEALKQLGVLGATQIGALQKFSHTSVLNRRNEIVGELSPTFYLKL